MTAVQISESQLEPVCRDIGGTSRDDVRLVRAETTQYGGGAGDLQNHDRRNTRSLK